MGRQDAEESSEDEIAIAELHGIRVRGGVEGSAPRRFEWEDGCSRVGAKPTCAGYNAPATWLQGVAAARAAGDSPRRRDVLVLQVAYSRNVIEVVIRSQDSRIIDDGVAGNKDVDRTCGGQVTKRSAGARSMRRNRAVTAGSPVASLAHTELSTRQSVMSSERDGPPEHRALREGQKAPRWR